MSIVISSPLPRRFDAGDGRDIGPRIVAIIGERGVRRLQRCDNPIEATFCAEAWEIGDFRTGRASGATGPDRHKGEESMPNTDPPIDLDSTVPLSPREVDHIRRVLRDDDRMSWLGRKLRFLVLPIAVAVATGACSSSGCCGM
jgi:hypothetical protein